MEAEELRVGFVGAGRMAGGLGRGLLRAGMGGTEPWVGALEPETRDFPQVWCPALQRGVGRRCAPPYVPAPMEQCGDTGDKAAPFEMSLSHTAEWGQLCLTPTSVTLSYRSVQGYEDKAVSSVP